MDLDDHDQLQNDNGEIDGGGVRACVETWTEKKEERGESQLTKMLLPTYFCVKMVKMRTMAHYNPY